ncbi:MAG: TRAP transporter substrate-binding protein DctP [Gammaproteobacteria bacterium]|nr:TRAP transporter substrate-binding protein DctP [Gammaproteobacteria bacterium]
MTTKLTEIKIRWVIAHDPISLFIRAARSFSKAINEKLTSTQIDIEIMTLSDYSQRYNNGIEVTKHDLLDLMNAGKIEMSQMYTTWLAEKYHSDMHVLDLPFLFRDHDHAQAVLEGNIGEQLLCGLTENSNIRGLAFTYSGGFRMIPGTKAIRSIHDFKGTSIRSNKNPYAMETFRSVGANPVARELEEINEGVEEGLFMGGESAWPRVYPLDQNKFSTVMNDTRHSLFLTSMIIQKTFWDTLDAETQSQIKFAAVNAAREERFASIQDGELAMEKARLEGIEIVTLPPEEMKKFEDATQSVYEKYGHHFPSGMIEKIKLH